MLLLFQQNDFKTILSVLMGVCSNCAALSEPNRSGFDEFTRKLSFIFL